MDYGSLIRDSWNLTWRYRFLWLLGLLAGGAVGVPSGTGGGRGNVTWQAGSADLRQLPPELARTAESVAAWAVANAALLIAAAAVAVLIGLTLLVLSFVAQGAMARATAELATGHESSLGSAWRQGIHLFWRYVGMWLLLAVAAILVAIVVGALFALLAGIAGLTANVAQLPAVLAAIAIMVIGVPVAIVGIAVGIVATIVVAFAQRAIAVEDVGPMMALSDAWNLFRTHIGTSLLVWLVNVALSIGIGIAVALGAAVVLAVLGGVGFLVWSALGASAGTFSYAALAGIVFFAGLALFVGIANTFFWNFWTIAYLRMSGQTPAAVAA